MKNPQYLLDQLEEIKKSIGYPFKDAKAILNALTHSSYANENKGTVESNERLEFLGDSVLSIIVSQYIFQQYQHLTEGELTKLRACVVCEPSLADCAIRLNIGRYLLLGKGEEATGGRNRVSILSDAFEAVLAAIYLDGGLEKAKTWALHQLKISIEDAEKGNSYLDYKTILQEKIQKRGEETVHYQVVNTTGPDHDKRFYVEVIFKQQVLGKGNGKSKKESEQNAARDALKRVNGD